MTTIVASGETRVDPPDWADDALRLLARAGRMLGTSLDYRSTLTGLAWLLVPEVADLCVVNLLEEDGRIRPLEVVHRDPELAQLVREKFARFPIVADTAGSRIAEVIRTARPRLVPTVTPAELEALAPDPEQRELLGRVGLQSLLVVPMRIRHQSVGALALARGAGRPAFTAADQALALEVADRAAVAVDHARLYRAEQLARAEAERAIATVRRLSGFTERLNRIVEALAEADSVDGVAEFISAQAAEACGAMGGWVTWLTPDGQSLEVVAAVGGAEGRIKLDYPRFAVTDAVPAAEVVRTRQPLYIASAAERVRRYPTIGEIQARLGYEASAVLPLLSGERCVGSIGFVFAGSREFSREEQEFLQAVARHCGVAFTRLELRRDLQEANARLELEQGRLRAVLDHLPAGLVVTEAPSGRIILYNAAAQELLGESFDGVGSTAALARFGGIRPDGRPYAPDDYPSARALRHGEVVTREELTYRRPDGRTIRLVASAAPVLSPDGQIAYAVSVFQDVTHQRELAEALASERARLTRVLEAAGMGTWEWDLATGRLSWDENLARLYGLAPGDTPATYHEFLQLVHPDDRELVDGTVRRALRERRNLDYEFRILHRDGRVRWIADQGRLFSGPNGAPASCAGVCVDVTERRRAQDHLREAQKLEAVGRLAGGMAHEINNMMTVALGFCEFLLKDPLLGDETRQDLREIQRAAERAAGVTRQVLAFSRQQVLLVEPLELNTVVSETHQMLRPLLDTTIEIVVELASGSTTVEGDRNSIGQVLVNLALNARDAMPAGGRLTIRTDTVLLEDPDLVDHDGTPVPPGEYVALRVSDTGLGMDAATLGQIFEPFFTTKAVGQGTGLGLSTVYGVVKQSHGFIWVTSEPGLGTTFRIAFPRVTPVTDQVPAAEPGSGRGRVAERILLVEDEPMVRTVASRALTALGYQVELAADGAEALDRLERGSELEPVDLVVTDIMMPHAGGSELGRQLRERFPDLPVIYMSGHPNEEMVGRGLITTAEHFIQKPFLPEALGDRVREVLDGA